MIRRKICKFLAHFILLDLKVLNLNFNSAISFPIKLHFVTAHYKENVTLSYYLGLLNSQTPAGNK